MNNAESSNSIAVLSWDKIHADCDALAAKIGRHGQWRGVIAVARGGLVPAALIARALGVRLVEAITVAGYDHQTKGKLKIISAFCPPEAGKDWLVIDDLSDTGRTFETLRSLMPAATFACAYVKPQGKPHVDFWLEEYPQTTWLYCPWEMRAGFSEKNYAVYE
jgi:xanthine phosphoribosyltransferase